MANLQNELAQVQHISGELHTNAHAKIGMVVGRFNSFVVESLVSGAIDTLLRHGIAGRNITVVRVPGAWEIPLAVARMAQTDKFDAIIGLGAVIRGSTPHFDFVAGESAKGLGATNGVETAEDGVFWCTVVEFIAFVWLLSSPLL